MLMTSAAPAGHSGSATSAVPDEASDAAVTWVWPAGVYLGLSAAIAVIWVLASERCQKSVKIVTLIFCRTHGNVGDHKPTAVKDIE